MAPFALVPVNRLDRAKGRLAEILSPPQREALVLATAATVIRAADAAGFDVAVLTGDPRIAAAVGSSARVIPERDDVEGLNAQIEAAVAALSVDELLVLHADLPLASAAAVRSLASVAFPAPSVTLVESADGGTNAMLLRPPGRFPLAYGPGSAALHRRRALEVGLLPLTFGEPGLSLDLDTPADVLRLLATPVGRESAAGQLLIGWGVETRIAPGPAGP